MSQHLFNDTDITAIANAIRAKDGTQTTMTVGQMPSRINDIPSGGTDYLAMKCDGTLTSYTVPEGVTKISNDCFHSSQFLQSVTLPSTLTEIGPYAFYGSGLTIVTFPSNLPNTFTTIKAYAFASCNSLTTLVNFNWKGSTIDTYAFQATALVGDIYLPNTQTIGATAFWNTRSAGVLNIHFANTSTNSSVLRSAYLIGANAFHSTHCALVVPVGTLSAYQSAFSSYSSLFVEETQ